MGGAEQLVVIDDALRALEQESERMARVFECRYFAGLTDEESAEALGLSLRTRAARLARCARVAGGTVGLTNRDQS